MVRFVRVFKSWVGIDGKVQCQCLVFCGLFCRISFVCFIQRSVTRTCHLVITNHVAFFLSLSGWPVQCHCQKQKSQIVCRQQAREAPWAAVLCVLGGGTFNNQPLQLCFAKESASLRVEQPKTCWEKKHNHLKMISQRGEKKRCDFFLAR